MQVGVAVGKFVVGKSEASKVVRIAELKAREAEVLAMAAKGEIVGVTPRAPHNKKEHIMEVEKAVSVLNKRLEGLKKPKFNSREEWAEANANVLSTNPRPVTDRAVRNANVGRFQNHAIAVAEQRMVDLGSFEVMVLGIEWFPRPDRFGRLGAMHVRLPEGYAEVRYYEQEEREAFWYDFCEFSLNQFKPTFNPMNGTGELILAIREGRDGQLYVNLPKSQYRGVYYDRLRTRDVRFPEAAANSFNNRNLEAALSAYLRFFTGEFVQANPLNRHGIDEHCGSCKFNMYIPGYDGMDTETSGFKNTLNTSDTVELAQWGQEIPRRYCMVHRELVDLEAVKEVNELLGREEKTYFDDEGRIRYVQEDEVIIAGKAVHKYVALKMGMTARCADCPFYHNNAPKTEEQISREKAEGKKYVSSYWSEDARAERMPIQTLVGDGKNKEWVTKYPGEVEHALDFRVYGIGGVVVYGSEEVARAARENGVLEFIPMTEEEDEIESHAAKVVNIIHETCNNYGNVKPDTLERVLELIKTKPEGISVRMERRWDRAVERLATTIAEYQSVE